MRRWGGAQHPHDAGGKPRWIRDRNGWYIVHDRPIDRQLGRCVQLSGRDTNPRTNLTKVVFSLRYPIRVLYMFLLVRWRTDHVRIQVRSVPNASQYEYTKELHTRLGKKNCALGL